MPVSHLNVVALLGAVVSLLPGCASRIGPVSAPDLVTDAMRSNLRSALPILSGADGERMSWDQLLQRVDAADVIIIGEQHDDAIGHAVQLAILEDALERNGRVALSMEMLDRAEQALVDDYLADFIDRDRFIEATASTRWRKISRDYLDGEINRKTFARRVTSMGWPQWEANYQPIIDAARHGGDPGSLVIAANAPWARYSKLIDENGYDGLMDLTPAQRALVTVPPEVPHDRYRERFWEFMVGRAEGAEPEPPPAGDEAGEKNPHTMAMSDDKVLSGFHAQLLYDATMADSIAEARRNDQAKIIHLVGQFHSDFGGGTARFVRQALPNDQVLVISMVAEMVDALRAEDQERADVIIYTGRGFLE